MNELALFAGAGGGLLGGLLLGWRTRCAVELDPYCRRVLLARQRDGLLPRFPIWDDIRTFDGRPWRGHIDVVSGGFPCQDISYAGRGDGIRGKRSGLWFEMARVIREVGPRYAYVENTPALASRGLDVVLGDLAEMGFNARWGVLGAIDVGAPHIRKRIWIVGTANGRDLQSALPHPIGDQLRQQPERGLGSAQETVGGEAVLGCDGAEGAVADPDGGRLQAQRERSVRANEDASHRGHPDGCGGADVRHPDGSGREQQRGSVADATEYPTAECPSWWLTEPDVDRVAHGVASRVDRLRALGNGQVPAVAALAWGVLTGDPPLD